MEGRQRAVAGAADRDGEAVRVLNRLGETESRDDRSVSLWDFRHEGTWIDRL